MPAAPALCDESSNALCPSGTPANRRAESLVISSAARTEEILTDRIFFTSKSI
jgi:hypothetical protein